MLIESISKDETLVDKLSDALYASTKDLLDLDVKVVAEEFLSKKRAIEQIELFMKITGIDFKGKKLLEVGAGVGAMLVIARSEYGIDAYGIEPSSDEFYSFESISSRLIEEYNLPKDIMVNSTAEKLPFEDNSFDLIYSTNVLEHVKDPKKVLSESVRVLKPGGYLQFVIPNYFSFWEGHYGVFWPCITNKFIGKIYVKLLGKNPAYVDTLQLINPFYLENILKDLNLNVEVISWGKKVFKDRLETGNYSDWASLKRIRFIIDIVQKMKISSLVANMLNLCGMYTPIVLTIKKRLI